MKTVRHLTVGVLLVMAGVAVGVRYGARFRELIRLARGNECFRTERYERMVRNHVRMDAQIEDEAVYYLGDSHIYGYFVGGGVNYGIGSDTTDGLLARLPLYHSISNGTKFVIEIGCNDYMVTKNAQEVAARIVRIVDYLPRPSEKVVCSLLPSAKGENSRFNREVNACLKRSSQGGTFKYVDLYSALAGADGNLLSAYDSGDGTHLNADGYKVFKRMISQ